MLGMDPRHAVASGDGIRPIQVAIDDRDDLEARLSVCGEVGDIDDRTRADDAEADAGARAGSSGRTRRRCASVAPASVSRLGAVLDLARRSGRHVDAPLGAADVVLDGRPDLEGGVDDGPGFAQVRLRVEKVVERLERRDEVEGRAFGRWRRGSRSLVSRATEHTSYTRS